MLLQAQVLWLGCVPGQEVLTRIIPLFNAYFRLSNEDSRTFLSTDTTHRQ